MKWMAVVLVVLVACGDAATPDPGPEDIILTVHRGGGLCVDGPCSTTWTVYGDGEVAVDDPAFEASPLRGDTLADLTELLELGPGELPPFTGTCPAAYDGPRWTYSFGDLTVDSCASDVSGSELVRLIHRVLDLGAPYV